MEQIKSYLSLQESVGKVLIVGDGQWEDTLARYLQRSGKAAGICRLTQQERKSAECGGAAEYGGRTGAADAAESVDSAESGSRTTD